MKLLAKIISDAMSGTSDIGPLLLKLRFLASKLNDGPLAEWVKHESEGYPTTAELPDYRKLGVFYKGHFSGPMQSQINNATIPSFAIAQYADNSWNTYEMRSSISAIDELVSQNDHGHPLINPDASNLVMLLTGNIFPGYSCVDVKGIISKSEVAAIRHAVRTRILELAIQIQREVPSASEITVETSDEISIQETQKVTEITNNVVYGNQNNIDSKGDNASITISVVQGDVGSLENALRDGGLEKSDAAELAQIIESEEPDPEKPLGKKAMKWIGDNIQKIVGSVGTSMITAAALQYYGL